MRFTHFLDCPNDGAEVVRSQRWSAFLLQLRDPPHNRFVERLMREVSKRCKNQWMRWTAEGLEALLQLWLVKYADPSHYQLFLDELPQRSIKTAMSCDLSTESTRGKL